MMKAKQLSEVAQLFGLSPEKAKERAATQELPIPAFRLGSQKSPWLVLESDLENLIEQKAREFTKDFNDVNAA